jgi:hypothetical protein
VGVRSVQGALHRTFDSPYHRLDPAFAADTKLVRQEEVTSVGVLDNGLCRQPADYSVGMYAVNPSRDSLLVAVLETFSPRQSHSLLSLMLSTCPSDIFHQRQ